MDDRLLVLEMISYIEKNLSSEIGTRELVEYSGYSLNRLRQKFFKVTGDTPSGYVRKRKLTEASKEILAGEKIIDVCLKYGYSSQDNFTTSFRSYFGVTPKEIYAMNRKYKKFIARLREVYNIMELINLKQPPFCSTLMGCIKGAADYFDLDLTAPMMFGLSGHAFLINIHKDLCPSGPYVWKKNGFYKCLSNIGIEIEKEDFFKKDSSLQDRVKVEKDVISALNDGNLGILAYMEFQLVSGYDENGFQFTLPWNTCDDQIEKKRLTFSSWEECLDQKGFAGFTIIKKGEITKDIIAMLKDSLCYALDFFKRPEEYQMENYKIGYGAYENWINAVKKGEGSKHGNWWNGMVWKECRKMAAEFFAEIQDILESDKASALSNELAEIYKKTADNFDQIKEKELKADNKIKLLEKNLELEHNAEQKIEALLKSIS